MREILKKIGNIIKYILLVIFIVYILVLIVQRVTNNNLSLGGYRVFTIVSESMVPKYNIGDILLVKETKSSKIKVGDDLCYMGNKDDFAGKVVTHQVKEIKEENGKYSFITEGIANLMPDPQVEESQIYGVVIYKTLILSFLNKCLQNKFIFFLVIFVPLFGYAIMKIIKAINDVTEDDENEKEEE